MRREQRDDKVKNTWQVWLSVCGKTRTLTRSWFWWSCETEKHDTIRLSVGHMMMMMVMMTVMIFFFKEWKHYNQDCWSWYFRSYVILFDRCRAKLTFVACPVFWLVSDIETICDYSQKKKKKINAALSTIPPNLWLGCFMIDLKTLSLRKGTGNVEDVTKTIPLYLMAQKKQKKNYNNLKLKTSLKQ